MPRRGCSLSLFVVRSRYAIKGSPNQKLLLEDIYYAIESRVRGFPLCRGACMLLIVCFLQFPYFRTAPPGWKVSIQMMKSSHTSHLRHLLNVLIACSLSDGSSSSTCRTPSATTSP